MKLTFLSLVLQGLVRQLAPAPTTTTTAAPNKITNVVGIFLTAPCLAVASSAPMGGPLASLVLATGFCFSSTRPSVPTPKGRLSAPATGLPSPAVPLVRRGTTLVGGPLGVTGLPFTRPGVLASGPFLPSSRVLFRAPPAVGEPTPPTVGTVPLPRGPLGPPGLGPPTGASRRRVPPAPRVGALPTGTPTDALAGLPFDAIVAGFVLASPVVGDAATGDVALVAVAPRGRVAALLPGIVAGTPGVVGARPLTVAAPRIVAAMGPPIVGQEETGLGGAPTGVLRPRGLATTGVGGAGVTPLPPLHGGAGTRRLLRPPARAALP